MEDVFTKFYNTYIQKIHDFLNSDTDLLFVSGFSGSGKSSVIKAALDEYENDILHFQCICFKNTVTDDFLLSFYDTFREYALKQIIALKKNPMEGFIQKVSFYFKNLELPSVVLIDNFDNVKNNEEISDFLAHISTFENVKVIIVSRKPESKIFEDKEIKIDTLEFEKIKKDDCINFLSQIFNDAERKLFEELYDVTGGYELYLKMTLLYLDSISISLSDFLDEYKQKKDEYLFEDFLVEKQISLIPSNYIPILNNLSCIYHNVPLSFIEAYGLGDIKQLSYLVSKFIVSEFFGTYYIKSYFRKYFEDNTSLQERNQISKNLIGVYDNELKKSPKDRLLRLSRASIRNCMDNLEEKIPKIARTKIQPIFNYNAQVINQNWFVTGGKEIKPRQKNAFSEIKNEPINKTDTKLNNLIKEAEEQQAAFNYREAISLFEQSKKIANKLDDFIRIYTNIANIAIKLNDNNLALVNYRELADICYKEENYDFWAKYKIEISKIYKNLYSFSKSLNTLNDLIKDENKISDASKASVKFALGELFEAQNDMKASMKEYKEALNLTLNACGQTDIMLPEIAYKIGSLYYENDYTDEALEYFNKSVEYSKTSSNTKFLPNAYTDMGTILADMGDNEGAIEYLNYALDLNIREENYTNSYYVVRNIAKVYRNFDFEKAYEYLNLALEYARMSDNSFEIAISLLELGDYYYDMRQNEQALICYFQAKSILGANASKENMQRVLTRINDMKIKLGDYIFKGMKQLYDN